MNMDVSLQTNLVYSTKALWSREEAKGGCRTSQLVENVNGLCSEVYGKSVHLRKWMAREICRKYATLPVRDAFNKSTSVCVCA